MTKLALASLAALAAAGCTPHAGPEGAAVPASQVRDEATLAGWTPDQTTSCISVPQIGQNRPFGNGDILFEGIGTRQVYVNHISGGCPEYRRDRAIRFRISGTRLCRGDIVTVFDPGSHFDYGSCALGDFTPYRR